MFRSPFGSDIEELLRKEFRKGQDQVTTIEVYLEKCRIRSANELIAQTDLEHIPKNILLANIQTIIAYKAKLTGYAEYIKAVANELASRGYNPKKELAPFLHTVWSL